MLDTGYAVIKVGGKCLYGIGYAVYAGKRLF